MATAIAESGRTLQGESVLLAVTPTETGMAGHTVFRFEIGGLSFFLWPLDVAPAPWNALSATADPLTILRLEQGELTADANIMDLVRATARSGS
jgi:hypothetical protein